MAQLIYGDRIGATALLKIGCAAAIFDERRGKILLTRRMDNGQWCLPGGGMDAGESASECCIREVWEETGLQVNITRLIGIYSSPHRIVRYADGNQFQFVSLIFESTIVGGSLGLSNETTEVGYFTEAEIREIDLIPNARERIDDAFALSGAPFIR